MFFNKGRRGGKRTAGNDGIKIGITTIMEFVVIYSYSSSNYFKLL